ncbi:MAG: glycosyltransferase family 4 protein, partial [Thermoanaerobaculia bacterium]
MPVVFFLLPAILAAAISFSLTPLVRRIALRVGAVDEPGPRKVHARPTPRLGGLAVVASAIVVAALVQSVHNPGIHKIDPSLLAGLAFGVLPVLLISIWDDIRPLRVLPRFIAQFAGAAVALHFGIQLGSRIHLFALDLSIGWLSVPLSLLWIVGVTNAFNIVDGLDGLSSGLALIAAFSLVGVGLVTGRITLASTSMILAGALLGFLPFNLFPARIFLGDTGSTAVGFWLACLALRGGSTLSAGMAILVPILVIGVPLTETLISMVRRFVRRMEKKGGGLFAADREHIHHRLVASGITQRRAVNLLHGAALVAAGAALVSLFLTTQA